MVIDWKKIPVQLKKNVKEFNNYAIESCFFFVETFSSEFQEMIWSISRIDRAIRRAFAKLYYRERAISLSMAFHNAKQRKNTKQFMFVGVLIEMK